MEKDEIKLLRINKTTWDKVKPYAKYGNTHDDIINNILNKLSKPSKVDIQNIVSKEEIDKIKDVYQQAVKSRHGKIRDVIKILCDKTGIKILDITI